MNPVTTPSHLVIPTIIAIVGIIVLLVFRRSINKSVFAGMLTFMTLYVLIVGMAIFDDINSQLHLNNFDLDQDGFFSTEEQTPEQELAMADLINDTGRNFSFITGGIVAFILGVAAYAVSRIYETIKSRLHN